ncbi:MAG: hypothetical protein RIK87_25600 [Fuerstiella sp.]
MSGRQYTGTEDQLWRAFRYVAGELSASEVEDFEQQVLTDVTLGDAVAEATLLASAVASGCADASVSSVTKRKPTTSKPAASSCSIGSVLPVATPSSSPVVGSGRRVIAAAATIVSCLCFAMLIFRPGVPVDSITELVEAEEPGSVEMLVTVWVDSSDSLTEFEAELEEPVEPELDVPDWMLAAVSLTAISEHDRPAGVDEDLMPDDRDLF